MGANVVRTGTAIGASTTVNGEFIIPNVPVGGHTVQVTYIGYIGKEISVLVEADKALVLVVSLGFNVIEGEQVRNLTAN
ncbi:MAG TPA: carboxypeptidase-like regulatory domain-containing protein [Calditrichaeota bacterium]|nr:carboxypeptidase-like regulatory domain-containing protein [Calditrichota bacterium]